MAATSSFANGSTIMNTTEDFDLFCVKLFVGPLVWIVISVPCLCFGVPASVWLLWVLIQRQCSGSPNNVYMLNLTVLDLIYNVFKLPEVLNFLAWHDINLVKVNHFFEGLEFNGRPLLMACSCVDCYMAVVHPISYMRISQYRNRAVVCAVVWVLTLTLSQLYPIYYGSVNDFVWEIPCVLAIFTITICDIVILHTLKRPDPTGKTDVHPQKQRVLQTITNSFVMTLISYLPILLAVMHKDLIPLNKQEVYCHIYMPTMLFPILGTTILPLLHLKNLGSWNDLRVCGFI